MPARSERLFIFPEKNGAPCWVRSFPLWWDRSAFINRYQHREIDFGNPIDANYGWLLNSAEVIAWNEQCTKDFSRDPRSSLREIIEDQQQLDSALRKARWVVVESYEWESGLD